jgi:hypothetical protein
MTTEGRFGPARLAAILALAFVLWFALGNAGLIVWVVVTAAEFFGTPPRWLLAASAVMLGLVPIAVLADGLPKPSTLATSFAQDHWVADVFAKMGVALLVVGVLRDALSLRGDDTARETLPSADGDTRSGVDGPDAPRRSEDGDTLVLSRDRIPHTPKHRPGPAVDQA